MCRKYLTNSSYTAGRSSIRKMDCLIPSPRYSSRDMQAASVTAPVSTPLNSSKTWCGSRKARGTGRRPCQAVNSRMVISRPGGTAILSITSWNERKSTDCASFS